MKVWFNWKYICIAGIKVKIDGVGNLTQKRDRLFEWNKLF